MEFKINEKLVNSILQYLASKPYAEVAGLIQELQKVEEIKEKKEKK